MYEHKHQRLLNRWEFLWRVVHHTLISFAAIAIALGVGVVGYHVLGGLSWIDSLLNASMILGGMGPVDPLPTSAAKVFASLYALFSGLLFIGILGLLIAPFFHRIMHKVHIEDKDDK